MTNYYEFNEHEYYALIRAEDLEDASKLYVEYIAGEDTEQVLDDGVPDILDKYTAFLKFAEGCFKYDDNTSFEKVVSEFEDLSSNVLLVDGSLL